MNPHYLYLLIDILIISFPLGGSFYKPISFYRNWKYLIPSFLIVMLLFIPWDVAFTNMGVWGFNPDYLAGIYLWNLPIEEWLFFILVPYSCVFIYESVNNLSSWDLSPGTTRRISLTLMMALTVLLMFFWNHWYTGVTFFLNLVFIGLAQFVFKWKFLGRLYIAYAFCLIPFFMSNGVLTGFGLEEPIVWYNDEENMGLRMITIPVEDTFYGFLLIGMNVGLLESFRKGTIED